MGRQGSSEGVSVKDAEQQGKPPAGFVLGEDGVHWGEPVEGDGYRVQAAWTADEGVTVQVDVQDCLRADVLAAFAATMSGLDVGEDRR